jgi:DNA-binding transcriptional MerR regulator
MSETAEKPYRSISEVSELLDVKAHVLRYWETQFASLRPRKNRAGARMYRPKDVELLREIRHLLHERGFTIAGARRKLSEERKPPDAPASSDAQGDARVAEPGQGQQAFDLGLGPAAIPVLRQIRSELAEIAALLKAPAGRGGH